MIRMFNPFIRFEAEDLIGWKWMIGLIILIIKSDKKKNKSNSLQLNFNWIHFVVFICFFFLFFLLFHSNSFYKWKKKSKYNKKLENEFFDKKKTKMKQMTEEMKQQLVGEVFKWNNIKIIHFLFWWIISFFHSIFLNLKIKIKTSFN